MKYSDQNPPLQCFMNQSSWAKGAVKNGTPVGILWHDTAGGNPNLKRYVQPDDDAPNRDELIALLGKNPYNNDWNHQAVDAGLNCWVGKLADGTVTTAQAGPWTTHAWGCGSGTRGSCNGYVKKNGKSTTTPEFWIQFEICDDAGKRAVTYYDEKVGAETTKYVLDYSLGKKEYFEAVYKEACEITAYLCQKFNIDPLGEVDYAGIKVPTILCHKDSSDLKLGSAHGDVLEWFKVYGYTMNDVRNDVAKLMGKEPTPTFKIGDEVYIKPGVTTFANKSPMQSWVPTYKPFYVRGLTVDKAVISTVKTGDITGTVWQKDIALITEEKPFEIGDKVKFSATATQWVNKSTIPQWVKDWDPLYVRDVREDGTKILVSTVIVGDITGLAWASDLEYSDKADTLDPLPACKYQITWHNGMSISIEEDGSETWSVEGQKLNFTFVSKDQVFSGIVCPDPEGNIYYIDALTKKSIWAYDYQEGWRDTAWKSIQTVDNPYTIFTDPDWYKFSAENVEELDMLLDDITPNPDKPVVIPVYEYKVEWFNDMTVHSENNAGVVLYSVTGRELPANFTSNGYIFVGIACDDEGNIYYRDGLSSKRIKVYDYKNGWVDSKYQIIEMEKNPEEVFKDFDWYSFFDDNALYPDYFDNDGNDDLTPDPKDDDSDPDPSPAPDPQPEPSPDPEPDPEPLPWLKRILIAILHALQKIFSKSSD